MRLVNALLALKVALVINVDEDLLKRAEMLAKPWVNEVLYATGHAPSLL
jgi:hypothetical protein